MIKFKVILAIILLAIIGRFIKLDHAPPHLSNDEIAAAYTAYSISKTSRDATNKFLPILWQSHGGYGSPLAAYTLIPSIMIFGNTDFAVRLPSAVLGSLTVLLIGLLAFELTKNKYLSILSSFILAISPWHFSASRWALESNYAFFYIVLGLYLFIYSINRHKNWAMIASFIPFVLSMYSYYTEWVLTPLIILTISIIYRNKVIKNRYYLIGVSIFCFLLAPLLISFAQTFATSRANSEFITKDIAVNKLLIEYTHPIQKIQIIIQAIIDKYSAYSSLEYLFFNGAKILPKENPYQFGFFEAPFVIAFIWGLSKIKYYYRKHSVLIFVLLIISPLVASMTEGEINNWRSLPQLLPVTLITASGVISIWKLLEKRFMFKALAISLVGVSLLYLFLAYFRHFPLEKAVNYQYGYKQIALFINEHYNEFDKIIIDHRFGDKNYYYRGVPNSYIPFYTYTDPEKVQNATYLPDGIAFDKYEFRSINWESETIETGCLYAIPFDIIPNEKYQLVLIHEIKLPNWRPAFRLYTKNIYQGRDGNLN